MVADLIFYSGFTLAIVAMLLYIFHDGGPPYDPPSNAGNDVIIIP